MADTNPMKKLADVFDMLIDELSREPVTVPAAPTVKQADVTPSPHHQLNALIKSATGEELPAEVADRIAQDPTLLAHVTKLAEYGARPTPMGNAVEKAGSAQPLTKQARTQSAWERWNQSVLNS